jgi:hypothetical protein
MLGLIWIGMTVTLGLAGVWMLYSMFMSGLSPGPTYTEPGTSWVSHFFYDKPSSREKCGLDLYFCLWAGLTIALPVMWWLS